MASDSVGVLPLTRCLHQAQQRPFASGHFPTPHCPFPIYSSVLPSSCYQNNLKNGIWLYHSCFPPRMDFPLLTGSSPGFPIGAETFTSSPATRHLISPPLPQKQTLNVLHPVLRGLSLLFCPNFLGSLPASAKAISAMFPLTLPSCPSLPSPQGSRLRLLGVGGVPHSPLALTAPLVSRHFHLDT